MEINYLNYHQLIEKISIKKKLLLKLWMNSKFKDSKKKKEKLN